MGQPFKDKDLIIRLAHQGDLYFLRCPNGHNIDKLTIKDSCECGENLQDVTLLTQEGELLAAGFTTTSEAIWFRVSKYQEGEIDRVILKASK